MTSAPRAGARREVLERMTMQDAHIDGAKAHDYKPTPTRTLRVHVLDGRPDGTPGGGVVLFHGGGWTAGSPLFLQPHARALAALGLVVVLPEYRVAMRDRTGIPECAHDAADAVSWVLGNAPQAGIDASRVALAGSSAGAHLALLTAAREAASVRAVVGWSTPCDLTAVRPGEGMTDEQRRDLSPLTYASGEMPPVLLLHGTADAIVPVDGCREFVATRTRAGGDAELVEFEGGPHAFERGERDGTPLLGVTIEIAARLLARTGVLPESR